MWHKYKRNVELLIQVQSRPMFTFGINFIRNYFELLTQVETKNV